MVLLPKSYQFIEVLGGYREYVPRVRLASIAWSRGVRSVRKRDRAVEPKIDDSLYVGIEAMDMSRLMVHRVCHEPYAIEPN